jgi:hypothetical protein
MVRRAEGELLVDRGYSRGASHLRNAAAIAGLAALLLAPAARAEHVVLDPGHFPRIVNGIDTHDFPTAGGLLYSLGGPITQDNAILWCSGTLIGCETFLVAGHCVDDQTAGHYVVYLQNAGLVSVTSITRHPSYHDATFPLFDVAVIKLGALVTGIDPSPINQTDPLPFVPAAGTIVGFGQTEGSANDYGIKRVGAVQTVSCPPDVPSGATDADVVCWNFAAPIGPPGSDSNTCNGDSGGPLFLDLGAGQVVAGVTSGGNSANCLPTDHSYDANVFTHRSFILGELGADSTAACGGLAPVGDAQTTVIEHDGTLASANPSAAFTVTVPAGANALRVTLNGEDNGFFDVNLYVKQGLGAGPSSFDCKADGASVFGSCNADLPAAGTWSIAVERGDAAIGAGQYQLTATIFGGAAPVCGNGTREFNEDCDGTDAALCPGQCDATCHCPEICTQDDFTDVKARVDAMRFKVRGRLLNSGGAFTGADPRQGFTLRLSQGANALTVTVPANDPGWASSKPARGRYKWVGTQNGITHVKAIHSAKTDMWKIVVIGKAVPGAGSIDVSQPVDIELTIAGACTTTTVP